MTVLRAHGVEIAASVATAAIVIALLVLLPLPRAAAPVAVDAALTGSTEYSLDSATIGTTVTVLRWHPQPLLAPARGQAIAFSGWALDGAERAPAGNVRAVVDGGSTFPAQTGMRRNDVVAKFGDAGLALSGFRLTIPPCSLSAGPHRIAFRFEAADGRGFYRSRDDVDLDVNGGAPASRVAYAVDGIVPAPSQRGVHTMSGWLVDAGSCSPARGVEVSIDGVDIATARYGLSRPDVARALGVPAYASSGFSATWSDASLAPGSHVMRLRALLDDGALHGGIDPGFELRFVR